VGAYVSIEKQEEQKEQEGRTTDKEEIYRCFDEVIRFSGFHITNLIKIEFIFYFSASSNFLASSLVKNES
jgi:hypothetical protein